MDALTNAFADSDRMVMAAKAARGGKIGRELATTSNWISRANASLAENAERYRYYKDWVYVCVKAIAQRVAGQPIRVARAKTAGRRGLKAFREKLGSKAFLDDLQPLDSHLFLDAVHKPNAVQVGSSLLFTTAASLKLTGESHWWISDNDDGSSEIWPLPSHWIRPADAMRSAWIIRPWYSATEFTVPADRVAYFNEPDPSNPFWAVSPLASQAHAVNTDEQIQLAQDQSFRNGIFPALAITVGDPLSPGDPNASVSLDEPSKNVITDALKRLYGGAGNFGGAIILDALIRKIDKISFSPDELAFSESGKLTKARIFQAFGVNPLIVGEIEGANRAQAVVAEQSFITNVINPLIELISQVMTRWVVPVWAGGSDSLVAWIEPARANDPEMLQKEWDAAFKTGAVTRNEYRTRYMGLEPVEGGDVFLTPLTVEPDPVGGGDGAT